MSSRREKTRVMAADLFCGAGGFSTGLLEACGDAGMEVELLAINHWQVAINTHSSNHPGARHLCESMDNVDPRKVVPGGHLHLLMASPECVHHSNARGGRPMSDQSRATAWHIIRWAEAIEIDNVLVENVREFQSWGPLYNSKSTDRRLHPPKPPLDGRPIPDRKGEHYRLFLRTLRALGYTVQDRVLNAAHYGDATTRQRLFIQARKGRRRITWPEPTHLPKSELSAYAGALPWRPARDIIDWTLPGKSIYGRKKPLAPNTLARIMAGLRKYSGLPFVIGQQSGAAPRSTDDPIPTIAGAGAISLAQPFLVVLRNHCGGRSVDDPLPVIAAKGNHIGLCEPYLMVNRTNNQPKSVDEPVPTLCTGDHMGLCEAFVMGTGGREGQMKPRSVDEPLRTILTNPRLNVIESFVIPLTHSGGENRTHDIEQPLPTVTCANRGELGVVQPFLVPQFGERDGQAPRTHSLESPLPAVTGHGAGALVEPFILPHQHGASSTENVKSVDEPMPTVTGQSSDIFLAEPFLVNMKGRSNACDVDAPAPTITAHAKHLYLAEPFIIGAGGPTGSGHPQSVDEPLGTVLAENHRGVVDPYLVKYHGNHAGRTDGDNRVHSVEEPLRTLDASNRVAVAQPFLLKCPGAHITDAPRDTVSGRDRYALVHPEVYDADHGEIVGVLDIRFRMLQPHELAGAMSFPADYQFSGNRDDQVKQIGNAVPVKIGRALCSAILQQMLGGAQ